MCRIPLSRRRFLVEMWGVADELGWVISSAGRRSIDQGCHTVPADPEAPVDCGGGVDGVDFSGSIDPKLTRARSRGLAFAQKPLARPLKKRASLFAGRLPVVRFVLLPLVLANCQPHV